MRNINQIRLVAALVLATALNLQSGRAQVALSGTNYTQNFNGIASGLPAGWSVRTNVTATSLGTVTAFTTSASAWSSSSGLFYNEAGTTNNSGAAATGAEVSATQSAFTNRCPAVRQLASGSLFGNPGAAFVLQITNTVGLSNLTFSVDLNMLSVQTRSTTWTIDYAVGNAPASFTTLGTYSDPGVFGTTTQTYNLGVNANNQSQNVWIRIVALAAATGSGSCDTFGIDNFSLNYAGPTKPTIASAPASRTNAVLTTATFAVAALGVPPFYYQWFKGTDPLTDGDTGYGSTISGSTGDTLTVSNLYHADAGGYSVIITNASGSVTSSVALAVVGFAINPIPPASTIGDATVDVPVSFIDNQTDITTLSGTSGNQGVLPDANISGNLDFGGDMLLTPLSGTNGVVRVTVTASDGSFSTNAPFSLLVVPSVSVLFNDHFDYPNGSVTAGSLGIWQNHSGTAGELAVSNGTLRVSNGLTEDANAALFTPNGPYDTNSPGALYSRFTLNVTELPTSTGAYFAHFKEASPSNFVARIWLSTANTNTAGTFRLGIGNGSASTATSKQFPQDLNLNSNYTVVTRLVLSNGVSTLWINPSSESDASVTANDAPPSYDVITAYAFRQISGEGKMAVDDLAVATSFHAAMGVPPPLSIQVINHQAVLMWNDPAFYLQSATNVAGPFYWFLQDYQSSPFTNSLGTTPQLFYRLISQPPPGGN